VIKTIDGKRITDPSQLSTVVAGKSPGQVVAVVVQRGGVSRTVHVTLGTRPAGTSSTP
jgi:S1-C subfamily serine protease